MEILLGINTLLPLMNTFLFCIFKNGWGLDFRVAYIKLELNSWSLNCDDIFLSLKKVTEEHTGSKISVHRQETFAMKDVSSSRHSYFQLIQRSSEIHLEKPDSNGSSRATQEPRRWFRCWLEYYRIFQGES